MYCLIGIDAQPDRIKAVLFDLRGNLIHQTAVENHRIGEGKIWEVDMLHVWENMVTAVKTLVQTAAVLPEEIAAIGVTGSEGGIWAIDGEGNPVMNAISADDGRGEEEAWEINVKTPGIGKLVHRNLGHPVGPGSTLVLLRWLKRNKPVSYDAIQKVFFEKDWIRYQLTDRIATDYSDGSSAFFRFANNGIPTQLLAVLGLNDVVEKIPAVLPGDALGGQLTESAAKLLGLTPGIPVATGCVNQVAACIGVGSCEKDHAVVFLDDQIKICLGHEKTGCDPGRTGRYFLPHAKKDTALEILSADHGLSNILWADHALKSDTQQVKVLEKGTLFLTAQNSANAAPQNEMSNKVQDVAQNAKGVIYCPFAGDLCGEVRQAGSFFGITPDTRVEEMLRAVYESVGFAIKSCLEIAGNIDRIFLTGGHFSGDTFLPQLISDITGKDIMVSEGSIFAAKGAAMLAGVAAGYYENIQDAVFQYCTDCKKVQSEPNAEYEKSYRLYSELGRACVVLQQLRRETGQQKD